jgi:hypothetical protein
LLYADDATLISNVDLSNVNKFNSSISYINNELNYVYEWLCINKLILNIDKTKFMLFKTQQRVANQIIKIKINNVPIDRVNDFNFLGLNIDENLTWKSHVNIVSKKLSKFSGILNKLKRFLPTRILRILYFSMVHSHLNYCVLSWGYKPRHIFKLQKKIIRIITKSKYNCHTEPLFKQLGILKLKDIIKVKAAKFYYKYCNDQLPAYFKSFQLRAQNSLHNYNTRRNNSIISRRTNTVFARNCLKHYLPTLINTLPHLVTDKIYTHSFDGFSTYIKKWIIDSYDIECRIPNCYICLRHV